MTNDKLILIIDDEEDIREVAQMCLELTAGWRTEGVGSGAEGLACARSDRPDAILLDVMMPGQDGIAVLGDLRADPLTAAIPVIMLTAKARTERHPPAGAAGVIVKPFDPAKLADQVAELLRWSSVSAHAPDGQSAGEPTLG
ncbi:MAG TPA: response regulator [Terriglobia bacterium]|nr:response regulator [Terriglobia bacterium]